jgi:uncharacterized membrane protein (DUF4010 family)
VTAEPLILLLVSALGGAAVGLERQRSGRAEGEAAHFGGLRTFTLLGLIGGIAGWLWTSGAALPGALLLGAAALLVVAAYAAVSRRDIDGTTEASALVVLGAGVLAGAGRLVPASAAFAVTTLLLVEKPRLHAFARLVDDTGFRAGVRFAVMALVVLPLLPEGPFGPLGGVRPRALWLLVLFFCGLSFAGYVARALVSERHGYAITGLLGGLVSSTSVTLTFARLSRSRPAEGQGLAQGVLAASSVLFVRVLIAVAVLSPMALPSLAATLALPALVGGLATIALGRGGPAEPAGEIGGPAHPLQLWAALQMAAAFQAVLLLLSIAQGWFGEAGLVWSSALLGLTDVDALTASFASKVGAGMAPAVGALGIAVGVLSNTLMKLAVAVVVGEGRFRWRAAAGLAAIAVAIGVGVVGRR